MSWFDTYGPYAIGREKRVCHTKQENLWATAESGETYVGLRQAIGCYMFCIRHGETIMPWYVGMTIDQDFERECFTSHKLLIYNECMAERSGTPILFLFPLMTDTEFRFSHSRKAEAETIKQLERALMGMAFARNREISNVRDMKFLRNIEVTGVLGKRGPGRPYREVTQVRKALFGTKKVMKSTETISD